MTTGGAAMRVTMNAVWERTQRTLSAHRGALALLGAVTLFVPAAVRAAVQASADPNAAGPAMIGGLVAILMVLVALWGQLALVAVAGEAAMTGPAALRLAGRRLPAAIGLAAVALVVVAVAFAPIGIAMARAGVDMVGMSGDGTVSMPPRLAGFVSVYTIVVTLVVLGVAARLAVLYPVVLFERRGIGAYARAWRLTRGHGWRILGVIVLYAVILIVATSAVRFVVGTVAALVLGIGVAAVLLALLAAAAVTAALSVVAVAFVTRLYLALAEIGADIGADGPAGIGQR